MVLASSSILDRFGSISDIIKKDGFKVDYKLHTLVDGENLVSFQYRVRVVDQRDQYRYELSEQFSVPNVSSLYIPDHYFDLETSYYTKFIDNGDSIVFRPGVYPGNHNLLNKNVVITSTHGSIITILSGVNNRQSVIRINKGRLENLGIQNGRGLVGGGVWAGGTALIQNCFNLS